MATRKRKTFEIEIPFEESINLHGNRAAMEIPKYRTFTIEKKSTLEMALNILLVVMIVVIALLCISIAMAGFSFFVWKLAEVFL